MVRWNDKIYVYNMGYVMFTNGNPFDSLFCCHQGAFFAFAILGEQLTEWGIAGASLITIAAATNAFLDLSDNKR